MTGAGWRAFRNAVRRSLIVSSRCATSTARLTVTPRQASRTASTKIAIQRPRPGLGHRAPRRRLGSNDKISGCPSTTYHRPPPPKPKPDQAAWPAPSGLLTTSLAYQPTVSQGSAGVHNRVPAAHLRAGSGWGWWCRCVRTGFAISGGPVRVARGASLGPACTCGGGGTGGRGRIRRSGRPGPRRSVWSRSQRAAGRPQPGAVHRALRARTRWTGFAAGPVAGLGVGVVAGTAGDGGQRGGQDARGAGAGWAGAGRAGAGRVRCPAGGGGRGGRRGRRRCRRGSAR